jgi:hypothetical protein
LAVAVIEIVTCSPIASWRQELEILSRVHRPRTGKLPAEQAGDLRAEPHALRAEVARPDLPVEFAVEPGRAEVAGDGGEKLHVMRLRVWVMLAPSPMLISSKQRFSRVSGVMVRSLEVVVMAVIRREEPIPRRQSRTLPASRK